MADTLTVPTMRDAGTDRPRIAHACIPDANPPQALCGAPLGRRPFMGPDAERCVVCLDLARLNFSTR